MSMFDKYFKLQQEIYDYFGFSEKWVVYPIDDRREYDWKIVNNEEVVYGEKYDIENEIGE